jgi:predicted PurR-regulated permease PerM
VSAQAHGRWLPLRRAVETSGASAILPAVTPERIVRFPARTILTVLGIAISVLLLLWVIWIVRSVITWILIALFLSLALNPAVDWLQRRGVHSRGVAVALALGGTLLALTGIAALFIPTLVSQVNDFANNVPDYLHQLTTGRGRLGFLQTKYHLVDKAREALHNGGARKLFGLSNTAVAVTKGVITAIVGFVTVVFMTFFMLLEGPDWVERFFSLVPEHSQPRWRRVAHDIYRSIGGYVTGNLLISLIAGVGTTIVLLIMGVPFAIALGLIVAILDLIPLAGATLAAIIVGVVAFLHSIPAGIVVLVFFIVYQQIENHVLQPVIYGRTVQLSPLAVLIAVLVGAEIAGILGALGAIPVAGTIQVILVDTLRVRRERSIITPSGEPVVEPGNP